MTRPAPASCWPASTTPPPASASCPSRSGTTLTCRPSPYGSDPTTASIGFTDGQAAGSAAPLTWGAASEVRLTADLGAGRSLEQPGVVRNRYVTHTTTTTDLTVTAPADQSPTAGNSDTVTGTATAGDTVDIGVVGVDAGGTSSSYTVTVPASGAFSVPVTVGVGTERHCGHGHLAQRRHRADHPYRRQRRGQRHPAVRLDRSEQRRQRPGHLRLSHVGQLQAGCVRPAGLPGVRHRVDGHLPGADP